MLHVEAALDELLGQGVEQLGIGGRVSCTDIVHGLDEADTQHITPQSVHVALGEILIGRRGGPLRELFTR